MTLRPETPGETDPRSSEPRNLFDLDRILRFVNPIWESFLATLNGGARVAIVYHADLDGAIGAAYVYQNLLQHSPPVQLLPRWVSTSDYSFDSLQTWIEESGLDHAVFCDISIENHRPVLVRIAASIRSTVLIYDDHVIAHADTALPPNVTLANPSDAKARWTGRPVPSFLFGYALSHQTQLSFPDWLLILALFVEGVDDFYRAEAALLLGVPQDTPAISLRSVFRRHVVARASSLIRAEFAFDHQEHVVLNAIRKVASDDIRTPKELIATLRPRLEKNAKEISEQIARNIERSEALIRSRNYEAGRVFFLPLEVSHAVIGPVCSVLRGNFPMHIFIGRVIKDGYASYELRLANDSSIDLTAVLKAISTRVDLASHGGHPSGAGALVATASVAAFEQCANAEFARLGFPWEVLN